MPRFFNRIRKQLAKDNKFFQYSRYAIGEILLVVIGILIALQLDAWNEERKEDEKIKLQLTNLLTNLSDDRDNLRGLRAFHAFRVHASYYLLNQNGVSEEITPLPEAGPIPELEETGLFSGPVPNSADKAFIERGFSWLLRNYPHQPSKDALDEFKSTGLFAEFENQKLKYEIRNYYSAFEFTFPVFDYGESNSTIRLKNAFASRGYSYLDVAVLENPVVELLSYPDHVAFIKNIIDESTYRSNQSSGLIRRLDQLILKIENEIDNYSYN